MNQLMNFMQDIYTRYTVYLLLEIDTYTELHVDHVVP